MTKEQAIEKLRDIQKGGDQEAAHMDADEVLCDLLKALGHADVIEEYEKVAKWYA
jgi:hypothetical protein